jgi:hypothetical protein
LYQSHMGVFQTEQRVGHLIRKSVKLLFMHLPTASSLDVQCCYFLVATAAC